jgi:UDP-glucuronate 4-epimerase
MAIANFIQKLMRSEEITVFGQGGTRDYTYIDDIIEGIYLTMTRCNESTVMNLGSGNPVPMAKLLEELNHYFPDMKVTRKLDRKGDVQSTWADIEKAKSLIGYHPKVDLKTGLLTTIEWAKQYECYL